MKEVILHIGLHKTGSTSIQSALKQYSKAEIKVASFDEENHSIPMYTIFSQHRNEYHIWKNAGYSNSKIEKLRESYLETLTNDLSDNQHEKLIISGEDISILTADEKNEMVHFFQDKKLKVKIIAYVRSPLEWIVSITQQLEKLGYPSREKIENSYRDALEPFLNVLSKNDIFVFSFDEVLSSHGSITEHLGDFLSIKLPILERENESLTPFQLSLLASLNDVPFTVINCERLYSRRNKILEKIHELSEETVINKRIDINFYVPLLSDMTKSDCQWLKENFGISYEFNYDGSQLSIKDYYTEILNNNYERIVDLFSKLGCVYDPSIGIQNNFLKVYIALETQEYNFFGDVYLSLNPDVNAANVNPYWHYLTYGINEGRKVR